MPIKLISLNIEGNHHLDRVIPFLKTQKPDVICLQELFEVDIPEFKKQLGYQIHYLPIIKFNRPFLNIPGRGNMGLALLTRLPINSVHHQHYYGQPNKIPLVKQPDSENRAVLWVTLTHRRQNYTIATTHFTWTPDGQPNPKQKKDLKNLLKILKTIPDFVLAGDFNAPRQRQTYQTIASKYKSHVPQSVKTTLDPKLHYANRETPGRLQLVVDHLFTTPNYQVNHLKVQCGLSDHCALIANIFKTTN